MKRSYEGVPCAKLTPAQLTELDADIRDVLEEGDRLADQIGDADDDQAEPLDDAEWASVIEQGPPR